MLIIDNMTLADTSGVFLVEEECFTKPWSCQSFVNELENKNAVTLIAIENHEVVGFINAHFILNEGYINNIGVTFKSRRAGVADMLLKKLIQLAEKKALDFLTLEVRKSNEAAIELYTKNGFTKVGERRNFYDEPNEDAILMTLSFSIK